MKMKFAVVLGFAASFLVAPGASAGFFSSKPATSEADDPSWRTPSFRREDANNDDKISKEEFLKDQEDAFKAKDANNDGFLSPDEFDFPPGMPEGVKASMRKHMQEDEARQKKMEEEMKARQAEDMKKMQAQQAAQKATTETNAKAATPVPEKEKAVTDAPVKENKTTDSVVKKKSVTDSTTQEKRNK